MNQILRVLNRLKPLRGLTQQELSWVLYDVGNSAFIMLACSLIPIWFKGIAIGTAPGQIDSDRATAYYSLAIALSTVLVALLGPVIGVLADHKGMKKRIFTGVVWMGVLACLFNGFVTGWFVFLAVYVLARICYCGSQTIYDSMLGDITEEDRMDVVSSFGYAWGYLGSCIPFAVALVAYVLGPDMAGILSDGVSKGIGFRSRQGGGFWSHCRS